MNERSKLKTLILLHALLLVYSLSSVFSKLASKATILSLTFCGCYGMVLIILMVYAIGWQQVIKRMPLSTAFANKAVTTVWGTVWGMTLFREKLTFGRAAGILMIVVGIILTAREDGAADE